MKTYCQKCVLPTDYLNIQIDDEGVCQHCRNFKQTDYLGTEKLKEAIQPALALNSSKKYDCVVGFSGGRDSTYLLWYVVKVLKLRPLAVFSDDLFIPEIAHKNMENTCKLLGVELRKIEHNHLKKNIKHHLKAWIKRPVPETLMFINVGERLGYETFVEKEAIKEGLHLFFGGRTTIQASEKYKRELMSYKHQEGRFSWILGYFNQVVKNPYLILSFRGVYTQFREFMIANWRKRIVKKHKLTRIHPFLQYVHWVEKDLEDVLFNQLEWEIPEGTKNSSRFGCEVDTLRQYLYLKTLGYNDTHVDLSYLIRDNQITREEASEVLESSLDISEDYIKYIIDKAGVDADEFLAQLDKVYPI